MEMISLSDEKDIPALKQMWKRTFDDSPSFIDLHFSYKFIPENTLVYRLDDQIVACLHMFEYSFRFWGELIQCYYLAGLSTLEEYRQRGIMSELMIQSNELMKKRNIPLAILIPANQELYHYYEKFDYTRVFDADNNIIPFEEILQNAKNVEDAYKKFDSLFREKDFCIQKTFSNFEAIVAEYADDPDIHKSNVAGMAMLVLPDKLFDIYKDKNENKLNFSLTNDNSILIENNTLYADKKYLCRLLFGYKTSELPSDISTFFPEHHPILNLMLE